VRDQGFLSGRLLIAMPGIGDPRFERAVVLVCAHDSDHAMGLAVNQPAGDLTVPDLLDRLGIEANIRAPRDLVMIGGPVERERGFVLHTDDYRCEHSLDVAPGMALTATREVLEAMAEGGGPPRRTLLALGYAGWAAGQLETEIRNNVWLVGDPDEDLLFEVEHDRKWAQALSKLGVDPGWLSSGAGRA
jgi:putative transcriptional regulator